MSRLSSQQGSVRRVVAVGLAATALCVGALATIVRPIHALANNNPCGSLWSDATSDAAAGSPSAQADQLDIVAGNMSDNGTSLTTSLTIKNLSQTVPLGAGTANEYYFVWTFNGTEYFTNAEYSTVTGIAYSYGTATTTAGSTQYSAAGTATGTFGSGANGQITVTVPFTNVGNPLAGDAFVAASIFGESGNLAGAAGSGLISTSDHDPSSFDYIVGQSCSGGPTPTPTVTFSPTGTPTTTGSSSCTVHSPEQNISENNFICPVEIPSSAGLGEPTIIHDSGAGNGTSHTPRLFVTAPQGLGNVQNGGSPLYTSTDGGLTWTGPQRSTFCSGTSGGDTDLVTDNIDNVYMTDLWLGNSCLTVSEDHGASFTAGSPFGTQPIPGDDRPWLALNSHSNQLYATYDGETALYLTNTAPIPATNPAAGLAGIQTIAQSTVTPEVAVNTSGEPDTVRACVCPPGGVAVDNTTGAHENRVYVSYSIQNGMAIAYMDPTGCPTACVSTTWTPVVITDNVGTSAFEDEWNFAPVKVDGNGTVYVMWAHALGFAGGVAGSGGVQEYYSYSKDGGVTWHAPILLSTETGTTTFPTMDIAANGTLDTAWYGTSATGDPNSVPGTASWNIYYARVTGADTGTPSFTPEVAVLDMHHGCIQTGGGKSCADRSLLDFFQVTSDPGSPNIIYTDGDLATGVNLWFTKLTQASTGTPEAPWAALLLLPGIGALALALRIRRRTGASEVV